MKKVTSEQMHNIDASATSIYGIPSLLLMENAGRSAFEYIKENFDVDKKITVVCGSGNNGGDGFGIAKFLFIAGYEVNIYFVGNEIKFSNDTKTNYEICKKLDISFENELVGEVIVDCLFGTGLKREIVGKYREVIEEINNSGKYIISIDMPSGLNSDDGKVMGIVVNSDIVLTFQLPKLGLTINSDFKDKYQVLDIFIPRALLGDGNE